MVLLPAAIAALPLLALSDRVLEQVYEPDLAAARAAGIAAAGESEEEQIEAVARDLLFRVRLHAPEGSEVEASRDEEGRIVLRVEGPLEEEDPERLEASAEALEVLRFMAVAENADLEPLGTSPREERERLERWREEHRSSHRRFPVARFREVPRDAGGPHPRLLWREHRSEDPAPLLVPANPAWDFRASDLARVLPDRDRRGDPAVGFELRPERSGAFSAFTEEHLNRRMAIVVNDEVVSAPVVQARLPGRGIISGRYTDQEVDELVAALRSVPLAAAVRLVESRRLAGWDD